jgi:4-hydroxy-2-oxoheptanedioate aldolase
LDFPVNQFKQALRSGRQLIGLWSSLASAAATEIVADSGFDWILIDTEHAPNETPMVADHLRAAALGTAAPVVRPAWNDVVILKRLLDVGAQTLLVPYVQSVDEAERAVSEYFQRADGEMCVLVQLETRRSLDALEQIAAVDGVDGVFIGPSDLAASFGYLGQNAHPEVRRAIEDACRRAQKAGTPIGILAPVEADARHFLDMGFNYVAVGSDAVTLRKGCDALVQLFKRSTP